MEGALGVGILERIFNQPAAQTIVVDAAHVPSALTRTNQRTSVRPTRVVADPAVQTVSVLIRTYSKNNGIFLFVKYFYKNLILNFTIIFLFKVIFDISNY